MYPYGLVGNCQASALIEDTGSIVWLCLPRPDSPPVFGQILDPDGGHFSISPIGSYKSKQQYIVNSNILVTIMTCDDGSEFKITDFCPRFEQYGRVYRPMSIFRIVEPIKGRPTIKVSCKPVIGWEKVPAQPIRGNSHIKFEIRNETLRVTTNMSLTYLIEEASFSLHEKLYFGLTWGAGLEDDVAKVSMQFLERTQLYWQSWVKHCSIPTLYQTETIRSALALKLHCYEDTGAILAALTTSLPEEILHTRNWDYRYCWLRDAAFVLSAFQSLGHFEEMEGFLKFLLDVAHRHEVALHGLRPVYALDQSLPLPECEHLNWAGYKNSKPVRSKNQAAEHVQNDVYGEMILALAPIFFDERFQHLRTQVHEELLQKLAVLCIQNISKSDAGLWEIRNGWQEHSFSNLMCWAGIERIIRIKKKGYLKELNLDQLLQAKVRAEESIQLAVREGTLRNGPQDATLDASLLFLPLLRYPDKNLNKETVLKISRELRLGESQNLMAFLYRYIRADDFGSPSSSFLICSFWLVQALVCIGEKDQALIVMNEILGAANSLGLYSEHFIPKEKHQIGNYPQAYSHVGLINAAFAVSPPWSEII
jgi:GH15 family glucan-1,4-alpha-glucosidase